MKFVIQRVNYASVKVDEQTVGQIKKGFLVLIGVNQTDTREIADKMIRKLIGMRIFSDENGKTNLALKDVDGKRFTIYTLCGLQERKPAVFYGCGFCRYG